MINTETSGGTRYSAGKPAFWWAIPWAGMELVARVTEYGAKKYAAYDWREGQSASTLLDCLFRHLTASMNKGLYARDPGSGEYHMAHAAWNILCLLHFMRTQPNGSFDDVTPQIGVTAGMLNTNDNKDMPVLP